jgi:hypothetical protein
MGEIFFKYKGIRKKEGAKSYRRRGFLINEEMRVYFFVHEEALNHMLNYFLTVLYIHIFL